MLIAEVRLCRISTTAVDMPEVHRRAFGNGIAGHDTDVGAAKLRPRHHMLNGMEGAVTLSCEWRALSR